MISIICLTAQAVGSYFYHPLIWSFGLTVPVVLLGIYEVLQTKRTLMRNYPIVGRARYWMEILRPKIYQYFVESDTDGTPISRIIRNVVYQRAKKQLASTPFGTQLDIYEPGYEWVNHSMNPLKLDAIDPNELRVSVGGSDCIKPYSLSIFNISAMSYGALSAQAIEALNWGAKEGNFAHNTGEGSASRFHLKRGGDLIWQIGTGYFGCRNEDGTFSAAKFAEKSNHPNIKMIEIKISQGAKPGHGGILPSQKNTPIIAEARGVEAWRRVESPSAHSAFSGNKELLEFIKKLRELSGGKPIGFKICMGSPSEFDDLCKTMVDTGIKPDFIAIDGGEGGTGAAPLEFSNSIGMSLKDGLVFASDYLNAYDLKKDIKIIASGKIMTGFDIIRNICLGADACYTARGMMLALGCIQALECNSNHCPTGVATQNPSLASGINVKEKHTRVFNYHHYTLEAVAEMLAAMGVGSTTQLGRTNLWRRISTNEISSYEKLFPEKNVGSSLLTSA